MSINVVFLCPLLTNIMSGLLAVIFLSVTMLKSYNSLYASFSSTGSGLCSHQGSALSKFSSLVRLQCTVDATALCLSRCMFQVCANFFKITLLLLLLLYFLAQHNDFTTPFL